MGKKWPLLSLFDFTGVQKIERQNNTILNYSHKTSNNWYRETQAPFPTHKTSNVIVGLQMRTLNNAPLVSIDFKKFLQLPSNTYTYVAIGL
jgi:hypothetical protein